MIIQVDKQTTTTPEFVKCVINLRGKMIPVLGLRLRFDMHSIDYMEYIYQNLSNFFISLLPALKGLPMGRQFSEPKGLFHIGYAEK